MAKQTVMVQPPIRGSSLTPTEQAWQFSVRDHAPLIEADTSGGNVALALPAAGLNSTTGQSNQNQELVYVKTSADGNSLTVTGAANGPQVTSTQYGVFRFKSNGTVWYLV